MATKSKELSIEDKLWKTADALRGSMDASEYRNVVLGLIFLKYVSDSFETHGFNFFFYCGKVDVNKE